MKMTESVTHDRFTEEPATTVETTAAETCNHVMNANLTRQYITSPNFPDNYPSNANCTWQLNVPDGFVLDIWVAEFDLEECCDYLMVKGAGGRWEDVGWKLSRYSMRFVTAGSVVRLKFRSDEGVSMRGFSASFAAVAEATTTLMETTTEPRPMKTTESVTHDRFTEEPATTVETTAAEKTTMRSATDQEKTTEEATSPTTTETTTKNTNRVKTTEFVTHDWFTEAPTTTSEPTTNQKFTTRAPTTKKFSTLHSLLPENITTTAQPHKTTEKTMTTNQPIETTEKPSNSSSAICNVGTVVIVNGVVSTNQITEISCPFKTDRCISSKYSIVQGFGSVHEATVIEGRCYHDCSLKCDRIKELVENMFNTRMLECSTSCCDNNNQCVESSVESQSTTLQQSSTSSPATSVNIDETTAKNPDLTTKFSSTIHETTKMLTTLFETTIRPIVDNKTTQVATKTQATTDTETASNQPSTAEIQQATTTVPDNNGTNTTSVSGKTPKTETYSSTTASVSGKSPKTETYNNTSQPNISLGNTTNVVEPDIRPITKHQTTKKEETTKIKTEVTTSLNVADTTKIFEPEKTTTAETAAETTEEEQTVAMETVTTTTTEDSYETASTSGEETMKCEEKHEFLPGCSMGDFFDKMWLCTASFFSGFPFPSQSICKSNINHYDSCMVAMIDICMGNVEEDVSYEGILDTFFQYFPGMFRIKQDVFCKKVYEAPRVYRHNNPCANIQHLQDDFLEGFVVKDSFSIMPFCKSFNDYKNTLFGLYDECEYDLLPYPMNVQRSAVKKMIVPKCLSTEKILEKLSQNIIKNPTLPEADSNGCTSYNLSCIFLIDGSSSLTKGNHFRDLTEFTKKVAEKFDLGSNSFGVMQYSHYYEQKELSDQRFLATEISVGQYKDHVKFNSALARIELHGYTTYTAHAIKKARTIDLKTRDNPCSKKAIVVLTDGRATDEKELSSEADAAISEGITMIAVGTNGAKKSELKKIAYGTSPPENERIYYTRKFRNLKNFVQGVRDDLMELLTTES